MPVATKPPTLGTTDQQIAPGGQGDQAAGVDRDHGALRVGAHRPGRAGCPRHTDAVGGAATAPVCTRSMARHVSATVIVMPGTKRSTRPSSPCTAIVMEKTRPARVSIEAAIVDSSERALAHSA